MTYQSALGGMNPWPGSQPTPQQPDPRTATYGFTAGILFARTVRDFLNKERFKGRSITFWESSGWIERQFVVKGLVGDVMAVKAALEDWARRMDAATD